MPSIALIDTAFPHSPSLMLKGIKYHVADRRMIAGYPVAILVRS